MKKFRNVLEIKRLTIEVPVALHNEIKARAAMRNITVRKLVIRAILEMIAKEKQYE